jgi:predicted DNA-binding protein (UPF0251 family)
MPRPPKYRRVEFMPQETYFKPVGVPLSCLEEIVLTAEELESLRLKNLEGLEQEECAARMGISRPTFQRILTSAGFKVTEALVKGKAIRIEGGNFQLAPIQYCCADCRCEWEAVPAKGENILCPSCAGRNIFCKDCLRGPGARGWGRCGRGRCNR